ncbi:MAG: sulfate reduction electron transfer complex DsrMKJOP subunit DsrJ [Pseudomonadota bacterium]
MQDAGKIFGGLAAFLVILTLPFWYAASIGETGARPEIELPEGEKQCVESKETMRDAHMDLLNSWRDEVVRDGNSEYISEAGIHYQKSLTNTCMKCHTDREQFCDKCHQYVSTTPTCWDCHAGRKGAK